MTTDPNSDNPKHSGISAALADQAALGADAAQIAEAVIDSLQEMEAALTPIIGKGGVVALYKRSRYLSSMTHAWLGAKNDSEATAMNLETLKSVLVQQSSANAAAGGRPAARVLPPASQLDWVVAGGPIASFHRFKKPLTRTPSKELSR